MSSRSVADPAAESFGWTVDARHPELSVKHAAEGCIYGESSMTTDGDDGAGAADRDHANICLAPQIHQADGATLLQLVQVQEDSRAPAGGKSLSGQALDIPQRSVHHVIGLRVGSADHCLEHDLPIADETMGSRGDRTAARLRVSDRRQGEQKEQGGGDPHVIEAGAGSR